MSKKKPSVVPASRYQHIRPYASALGWSGGVNRAWAPVRYHGQIAWADGHLMIRREPRKGLRDMPTDDLMPALQRSLNAYREHRLDDMINLSNQPVELTPALQGELIGMVSSHTPSGLSSPVVVFQTEGGLVVCIERHYYSLIRQHYPRAIAYCQYAQYGREKRMVFASSRGTVYAICASVYRRIVNTTAIANAIEQLTEVARKAA